MATISEHNPFSVLGIKALLVSDGVYSLSNKNRGAPYMSFIKLVFVSLLFLIPYSTWAEQFVSAEHIFVAGDPEKFSGWPANNGVWQWGDEILVGFTEGDFVKSRSHNLRGIQHSKFARSTDGGESWSVFDPENFLDDENIKWIAKGKKQLKKPMNFDDPNFSLRVFASGYHGNADPDGGFYYSYDRGATWEGPHFLGTLNEHPELKGKVLSPRTDYIVTGPKSMFLFISVNEYITERSSRLACIKTEDGGLSFEFVTWITPLTPEFRSIMPQTIQLSNGEYILTCRKIFNTKFHVGLVDAYISKDNCETWEYLSRIKEIRTHSNPPALVELDGGQLCCIYGDRDTKRMAGKYSTDGGKTWGPEFIIRDDFQSVDEWADLGYPRLIQRPDGKLVAMYYWATKEHPQQFIGASIWDPTSPPHPKHEILFHSGMDGVTNYRIPALAVTNNDVVIAVSDARYGKGQDLPNNIDLVMRRSFDSGRTWTESSVVSDFGEQGGGDPALLVDRDTGRVWCFLTYAPDGVGVRTSQPGIDGKTFQLHLMHSDDDGATWSKPININKDVKNPDWDAVWSSPGNGYQADSGRLYFPLSRKSGDTFYSHYIYSDDHGETWAMGGPAGERSEEWMLVEKSDGTLLANMRNHYEKNLRATAYSEDKGKTWINYTHHPELISPVCQSAMRWYDPVEKEYLLFSNPAEKTRSNMTVRVSGDEGKTWSHAKVLYEGPSAYSSMALLPDGSIGILYERGEENPYQTVVFTKFSLEWVME